MQPSQVAMRFFLELLHELQVAGEGRILLQKGLLEVHDVFVGGLPIPEHLHRPEIVVLQDLHEMQLLEEVGAFASRRFGTHAML